MDNQQIFDKAVKGLASQGFKRSMRSGTKECAYRGEGCRRCAIGWLIPNSNYSTKLEGKTSVYIDVRQAAGLKHDQQAFARRLQDAHDYAKNEYGVKENLLEVASSFNLKIPEVLQA